MPKPLAEETKQQVINLWMNHDFTQQKCADYLGISYGSVKRIISEYTTDGLHEPPKDMPMLEPAANGKTDLDEIMETDVSDSKECLPPAVILAISGRIHEIDDEVDKLQENTKELTDKIKFLTDERYQLAEFIEGRA